MCPKCGKRVPQRYRESHSLIHFNDSSDKEFQRMVAIGPSGTKFKNKWDHMKYTVHAQKAEEEKKAKRK